VTKKDEISAGMNVQLDATPVAKPGSDPEIAAAAPKVPVAITSSLVNLSVAPLWRGCIDAFTGVVIRGWVVSTENLLKPVNLDLYVCGILIAKTSSRLNRSDIAKSVALPIKAGFQVSIHGVATETVATVLVELKKIKTPKVPLQSLVTVKIDGTDHVLPFSSRLRKEQIEIAPLAEIFDTAIGAKVRNEYISIRDQLMESSTFAAEAEAGDVRAIAYYLPQFHPFPENDEWWGTGFTEWTNVVTAKPYLPDHYQPHLPADLGFYDLRLDSVHRDQIALARKYSVSGFCYYYYWFSGKTLMTMPIDRHVEQDYDFDFCLCWANENWSRRWDGSENDVLMAQRHVAEDDVAFIRSCLKYFKSPRYIKIDGAPLLQVYRVSLLENPQETIARWREIVMAEGFPGLHVSMVESFGLDKPYDHGCDSSSQFPPHGTLAEARTKEYADLDPIFTGKIYDYTEIVRSEIARPPADHMQFRTAMPSWDNTSRKGPAGTIFHGASPQAFEAWLTHLAENARATLPEGQRLVFINAWNEWAEGAHLEPDRKNGHAWLQAVRRALTPDHKGLAALTAPGATPEGLAETQQLVERLLNSNAQLKAILKPRYGLMASRASRFAQVTDDLLEVVPGPAESRAWIDSLNGRDMLNLPLAALARQQGLVLRGWVRAPGINLWKTVPLFVSLKDVFPDNGLPRRVMASIFDRESRPDVVESLGLDESALWCGFSVQTNLRDVPPGRYELEIAVADLRNPNQAIAIPAAIALILG